MKPVLPLLILLTALPAGATTPDDCLADLNALGAVVRRAAPSDAPPGGLVALLTAPPTVEDGFCTLPEQVVSLSTAGSMIQELVFGPIRWQAEWADPTRPFPPARLSLRVDRVMNLIVAGPKEMDVMDVMGDIGPVIAYQSRLINEVSPYHLALDLTFDAPTKTAEITNFTVQHGDWDGLSFRARVTDLDLGAMFSADPGTLPPLDRLMPARLHHVDLSLTNFTIFEVMAMAWMNWIYPAMGDTPEAALAATVAQAKTQVASVPAPLMAPESRAALVAMLDSLPHPTGRLQLVLDAPDGIEPARIATTVALVAEPDWASFTPLLQGASLSASWTPIDPRPQPSPAEH